VVTLFFFEAAEAGAFLVGVFLVAAAFVVAITIPLNWLGFSLSSSMQRMCMKFKGLSVITLDETPKSMLLSTL